MIAADLDRQAMSRSVDDLVELIREWKLVDWKEDNFLYDLPGKWSCSFAILAEGSIIGFCIASEKITGAYYIHLLFVANAYRKQGVGRKIIDVAKQRCIDRGLKRIILRCPVTNHKAVEFYKHQGFDIHSKVQDEISGSVEDYVMHMDVI